MIIDRGSVLLLLLIQIVLTEIRMVLALNVHGLVALVNGAAAVAIGAARARVWVVGVLPHYKS